jgi:hypothetical protein
VSIFVGDATVGGAGGRDKTAVANFPSTVATLTMSSASVVSSTVDSILSIKGEISKDKASLDVKVSNTVLGNPDFGTQLGHWIMVHHSKPQFATQTCIFRPNIKRSKNINVVTHYLFSAKNESTLNVKCLKLNITVFVACAHHVDKILGN